MELKRKLFILADAAKYDASCASSGAQKRNSLGGKGIGSTEGSGICHSYAPDGRCISLLKVLLTNWCIYDCLYCINRHSSAVPRARFQIDEVVNLTLDFYRRNVIEGLFLSSGIIQSPDHTMEQVIEVARRLREVHGFKGYIHLKTIPDASAELIERAGLYADRLSINLELPSPQSLAELAPEKDLNGIRKSMARIHLKLEDHKEQQREARKIRSLPRSQANPIAPRRYAMSGQSTQMIIGADASSDALILKTSVAMYQSYRMKRVYYSAFSPIPHASSKLPPAAAPLMREHRLYQADWLMRFYGFDADEIVTPGGMLSLDHDPKLTWALAHPERFPIDLNRAPREELLRVPGLGVKSVSKLLAARRVRRLRTDDLSGLQVPVSKVLPFVVLADRHPTRQDLSAMHARMQPQARPEQMSLAL